MGKDSIKKEKKAKKDKLTLKRLLSNVFYVLGYAWREDKKMMMLYTTGIICFIVGNAVVDTVFLKIIIDMITGDTPFYHILWFMLFYIVFFAAFIIINIVAENYMEIRLVKVLGNIQRALLKKASRMDLICYDKAEYYDDFVVSAQQGEEMIRLAVTQTAYTIGTLLGMLVAGAVIFFINPIIAIFPVLGFIVNITTRFTITKYEYDYEVEKKKINRKSDYSKRVFYQPEFAKEIKLSDIAAPLKAQFHASLDEEKRMAKGYGIKIALWSLVNWIVVFTLLGYFLLPLYLGYLAIVKMKIKLGDVASLNNAAHNIRNNLDGLNYCLVNIQKVGQYAEKFRKFNDYKETIEGSKGSRDVPESGVLDIRNMSYKYDGEAKYTLKNINLTIKKGEKIAIVGENGAGKTTLIKLLMRLYDVSDGEITFDGIDIRDFDVKAYRDKIGAVFQDYQIYGGTLGENVVMDNYEDTFEENVNQALNKADFSEKLNKLGGDLKVELTREFADEGTMLSGGEGQKVAISRMFAKGSCPVAILDEPSSALDPVAEYTLNTNMMQNAKDSTIIFISHRLSTTREADKIYLFEHGEIVEQGNHSELMELDGSYARMFKVQAKYYKLES